jgi:hypothetical protein
MTLEGAQALVEELAFVRSDTQALLEQSAGETSEAVTVYRPYIVAFYLWWTSKNTQRLQEAEGAVFERQRRAMRDLLNSQEIHDVNLTIPENWTVAAMRRLLGGGNTFEVRF